LKRDEEMKRIFIDVVVQSSFAKWQTHKYIPLVDGLVKVIPFISDKHGYWLEPILQHANIIV